MRALWSIVLMTAACAGCASVPEEDVFCRMTAERWETVPEGRAHALIEHYYDVEPSASPDEIFRLCKQHEQEALEHLDRY